MNSKTLLIMDESMVDVKIMKKIIESSIQDIAVIYNLNGYNYFEQIHEFDVKLIILEVVIDKFRGSDILNSLKSNQETSGIPVIVCASMEDENGIKQMMSLGAFDYIKKPLNDSEMHFALNIKIKNALGKRELEEKIAKICGFDELTGMFTRKQFMREYVKSFGTKAHELCIILMDINGLKLINDVSGNESGDCVIREVAQTIAQLAQHYSCSARWGSDEFILLMEGKSKKKIEEFITILHQEIVNKRSLEYDVTFGYAMTTNSQTQLEDLIHLAEDDLFSNKILEKGNVRRGTIDTVLKTLHEKNPQEELHSHRVSFISGKICEELKFSEHEKKRVKLAALMHDIGKITISEGILNKSSSLTNKEWLEIKKHPENGFRILNTSLDTLEIANAVLSHHERWDGKGYPKGISNDTIPFMSRIIAVADTFDAITSKRSYKKSVPMSDAIEEIKRCSGSQFDPFIVDAFLSYVDKMHLEEVEVEI